MSEAPSPRAMKAGVWPTAFQARTGELTAPGIFFAARAKRAAEFSCEIFIGIRFLHRTRSIRQSIKRVTGSSGAEFPDLTIAFDGFQSQHPKRHRSTCGTSYKVEKLY